MDEQKDKLCLRVTISTELSQASKDLLAGESLYENLTPKERAARQKLWVLAMGAVPQTDVADVESCN